LIHDSYPRFRGPLFIVGMPRSGTKLLRGLLNEHPRIGIPFIETDFLPDLIRQERDLGDLARPDNFHRFYRRVTKLPYFIYMRQKSLLIREDDWFGYCRDHTLRGVFEALVRHDADVGFDTDRIWGDKSPSYITETVLLKRFYPQARFIHIVRDVRDYCLSIHHAWGKNMVRAAQRWAQDTHQCRVDSRHLGQDYLEVKYEDVLTNTKHELARVAEFLEVDFLDEMTVLSRSVEGRGSGRGKSEVLRNNQRKYESHMDPAIRGEIESVAADSLRLFGYEVDPSLPIRKVSAARMLYYRALDGISLLRSSWRKRGLIASLQFYSKHSPISPGRGRRAL
jgi:hypothetical protein